jgi:preprotein translocase subunit SecD
MRIRGNVFNLYLIFGLILGLAVGCKSPSEEEKILSTLRLYLETKANPMDPMSHTDTAEVYRHSPVVFTIDKVPFLTEANIKEAKVIDVTGGFALQIQFDEQGTWLLEEYTSANRGKHVPIESQFDNPGEQKINKGRWLAAPQIRNHITDGLLTFTPDATKEEADRIATGLNNVAHKLATGEPIKW